MGPAVVHPKRFVLFDEGQAALGVYLVWSGRIKLSINSYDGRSFILGFVGRGCVLGLPCAVAGVSHSTSAVVTEAAMVSFVERSRLVRHMRDSVLPQQPAEQRLARFFLGVCPAHGHSEKPERIALPPCQEEIGQMLELSRETVTRVLANFQKRGVLGLGRKHFTLYDRKALEMLAGAQEPQKEATSARRLAAQRRSREASKDSTQKRIRIPRRRRQVGQSRAVRLPM